MFEWFILIFVLTILYLIMKTPKTPTEKPASKAKTEQVVVAVAKETKTKKPSSAKTPKQLQAATPKPVSKAKTEQPVAVAAIEESPGKSQAAEPKPVVTATEITPSERVGLTSGSIWHYLAENGASSVAKLIRELPEEEKIVQRSIGWLAQEGKITLYIVDRVEIVALK